MRLEKTDKIVRWCGRQYRYLYIYRSWCECGLNQAVHLKRSRKCLSSYFWVNYLFTLTLVTDVSTILAISLWLQMWFGELEFSIGAIGFLMLLLNAMLLRNVNVKNLFCCCCCFCKYLQVKCVISVPLMLLNTIAKIMFAPTHLKNWLDKQVLLSQTNTIGSAINYISRARLGPSNK